MRKRKRCKEQRAGSAKTSDTPRQEQTQEVTGVRKAQHTSAAVGTALKQGVPRGQTLRGRRSECREAARHISGCWLGCHRLHSRRVLRQHACIPLIKEQHAPLRPTPASLRSYSYIPLGSLKAFVDLGGSVTHAGFNEASAPSRKGNSHRDVFYLFFGLWKSVT